MENNYWIYEDYFIFKPEFNGLIDDCIPMISNYKKLIFSNYDNYELCIETNNEYIDKYSENYKKSKFNQPLENSLNNLTQLVELTFGNLFNQPLENSLNNLTRLVKLTLGFKFNQELNIPLT